MLKCLVWRDGIHHVYLSHSGAHEELCLDCEVSVGGDWDEAIVVFEDSPPSPPAANGLWRMEWPWRALTEADYEAGESRELCCRYEGRPTWTFLVSPLELQR